MELVNGACEVNNTVTGTGFGRVLSDEDLVGANITGPEPSLSVNGALRIMNTGATDPDTDWSLQLGRSVIQGRQGSNASNSIEINPNGGTVEIGDDGGADDGGVVIRFQGDRCLQTTELINGAIEVNNTVTGAGFERVLTVSDLTSILARLDALEA